MKRDSLGVPLDPEEPKAVFTDSYGDTIYEGEKYFVDGWGQIVKESNISTYLEDEGKWLIARRLGHEK